MLNSQELPMMCSLCKRPATTTGEHQACALSCGHIFGYSCIINYFSLNPDCPFCNTPIRQREIRMLFFDNHIPFSEDVLKSEHQKLRLKEDDYQVLIKEKAQLEKQLAQLRDDLAARYQPTYEKSQRKTIRVLNQPSIVLNRPINEGNRVLFIGDYIVYTECFSNQVFGITYGDIDDPQNFQRLSLHTMQIRDMSVHPSSTSIISTVSIDKTVSIVDLISQRVSRVDMGVPLWSCCWFDDSTVIVGGDRGTIIGVNVNTMQKTFEKSEPGPPIFSLKTITPTTVLTANGRHTQIFDLNQQKFFPVEAAANSVLFNDEKLTNMQQLLIMTRTREKDAHALFCKLQNGAPWPAVSIKIPYFSGLIKPSLVETGGQIYVALPMEDENDFSFRMISNPQVDLFMKWRNRFPKLSKPPSDLAMIVNDDFLLAVVTKDMIRVYALPIETD